MKNEPFYTVEKMCKALKVGKKGYYRYKQKCHLSVIQHPLKELILELFVGSKQRYGSIKITKELQKMGYAYSVSWIARLMQQMGLKSIVNKKYVVTTDFKHKFPIAQNLLNRNFKVSQIGKVWVFDITYIKVGENWNYLTSIIDLADRKVVGYSLSNNLTTQGTVIAAWNNNARINRQIIQGFIFHSDRGVQYASKAFTTILNQNLFITQSMSRKANCWDNAVAESFF